MSAFSQTSSSSTNALLTEGNKRPNKYMKYAATFHCGEFEITSHCTIVQGQGDNPPPESFMSIIVHNHMHFKENAKMFVRLSSFLQIEYF